MVATREAYGNALLRIGGADSRVVAMDGDTKNSTFAEKFAKRFHDRFAECFIAEQCMVGVAAGFDARGKVPFASTFACFFTRAYDQIRVAGISMANLKASRLARGREHWRGWPLTNGIGRHRHDAGDRRQHGVVRQRCGLCRKVDGADGRP